ncbi:hypothetical protein L1987_15572 [Smallanthus sonchifolius]|uniref:Uncharacterized protein n=1 Tax=Smallanthus sonchifolius TaxID=185202 RepID=A0ACB9J5U8_9ASTR|nr:hypothetical protein L1987_15572 [Smallanthus sonchifolius]
MAQLSSDGLWWWEVIMSNNKDEFTLPILVTIALVMLAIFFSTSLHVRARHHQVPFPCLLLGTFHFLVPTWLTPTVPSSSSIASLAASVITYGGQDLVWAMNNSSWRNLRKIFVHEALSSKNLEACSSFRSDEVRKTIKNVFSKIGTSIDINKISFLTQSSVLTSMIWGNTSDREVKHSHLGSELQMVASNITEIFGRPNLSDFFPILACFDLQRVEQDMKKQLQKLDQIIESMIEDRIKSNTQKPHDGVGDHEGKKDFLQILLDLRNQEDANSLNITHIKALLLDIMIAGAETTSTLIEWTMAEVMQNHHVMKTIQHELADVVGLNNIVEESHLPKLKYLDAVIKETLWLNPVVPFLIPRGIFDIGTTPWNFILRGLPLAEKMMMFILASLLHSFNWSLPNGEEHDLSEKAGITLKKAKPLIVTPSQRLPNVSLYM